MVFPVFPRIFWEAFCTPEGRPLPPNKLPNKLAPAPISGPMKAAIISPNTSIEVSYTQVVPVQ
jgi:hypothetical protein